MPSTGRPVPPVDDSTCTRLPAAGWQEPLVLGRQAVDPGGHDRVHAGWDLDLVERARELVPGSPARVPFSRRARTTSSTKYGFPPVRSATKPTMGARVGSTPSISPTS